MKHFGNSLSFDEIMEDMKFIQIKNKYTATVNIEQRRGQYIDGEFHKTKSVIKPYHLVIELNTYRLEKGDTECWCYSDGDGINQYFKTVQQAKRYAKTQFINTKINWN